MSYALACLRLDRSQEIRPLTERVLASKPGEMLRATAYATLIEALRSEGRYRDANDAGRRLLDEAGSNFSKSIAYYEMAYNLAEMDEDLDQALDFARRSLEHAPEELRQFPLAALGWVHYKRQELDEAIEFLSQSTELGPSTAALTRLGMALLASGDEDGARGALAQARPTRRAWRRDRGEDDGVHEGLRAHHRARAPLIKPGIAAAEPAVQRGADADAGDDRPGPAANVGRHLHQAQGQKPAQGGRKRPARQAQATRQQQPLPPPGTPPPCPTACRRGSLLHRRRAGARRPVPAPPRSARRRSRPRRVPPPARRRSCGTAARAHSAPSPSTPGRSRATSTTVTSSQGEQEGEVQQRHRGGTARPGRAAALPPGRPATTARPGKPRCGPRRRRPTPRPHCRPARTRRRQAAPANPVRHRRRARSRRPERRHRCGRRRSRRPRPTAPRRGVPGLFRSRATGPGQPRPDRSPRPGCRFPPSTRPPPQLSVAAATANRVRP